MNDGSSERAGVLIVRLWIEQDHPTRLRARITQTVDDTKGESTVAVASSGEEVSAIVRAWVMDFTLAGDGHVTPTGEGQPS